MSNDMNLLALFVDDKPVSITRDNFSDETGQFVYCALHDTYEWYDSYDELVNKNWGEDIDITFFVPDEYALECYLIRTNI